MALHQGGGDFDISDLFEESDSGRPGKGKKKGSKDKGKEAKQDEKQAVKAVKQETTEATEEAVADPNAETLETKVRQLCACNAWACVSRQAVCVTA